MTRTCRASNDSRTALPVTRVSSSTSRRDCVFTDDFYWTCFSGWFLAGPLRDWTFLQQVTSVYVPRGFIDSDRLDLKSVMRQTACSAEATPTVRIARFA